MKSPFPGMDPFLEMSWLDVHTRLIGYVADELQPQLSNDLFARIEEQISIEDNDDSASHRANVGVSHDPQEFSTSGTAATVVVDEPVLLEPLLDPIRARSIQVYDSEGLRVITAIEVFSPWNKLTGQGLKKWLRKREMLIDSGTNLVEIDLIRAGDWTDMVGLMSIPKPYRSTYRVTVSTPSELGLYLYPIPLSARLPTIKIPLRPQETPAKIDLQPLIDKAYRMGRYDRINYREPLKPPFTVAEKDWVDGILSDRVAPG